MKMSMYIIIFCTTRFRIDFLIISAVLFYNNQDLWVDFMKSMKNPGYLLVQVRVRLCQAWLGHSLTLISSVLTLMNKVLVSKEVIHFNNV